MGFVTNHVVRGRMSIAGWGGGGGGWGGGKNRFIFLIFNQWFLCDF